MPTYEYACRACEHRFEIWQKMTDEPLTVCPQCGGQIRRVLFPTGIVFKGHGFYKTDYNGTSANGSSSSREESKTAASDHSAASDHADSTAGSASGASGKESVASSKA
jgi:putative FmdB family regulatory protein